MVLKLRKGRYLERLQQLGLLVRKLQEVVRDWRKLSLTLTRASISSRCQVLSTDTRQNLSREDTGSGWTWSDVVAKEAVEVGWIRE